MTSATTVARYLEHRGVTGETQLHKLVYYVQAWALVWTGRPLFVEDLEAWQGGPVVPAVRETAFRPDPGIALLDLSADEVAIIDAVYDHYSKHGGKKLSALTHAETPWQEAYAARSSTRHKPVISRDLMRRAYTAQALESPGSSPRPPVLTVSATGDDVSVAAVLERARWRTLLDRLADQ